MPKEVYHCIFLSLILTDSVLKWIKTIICKRFLNNAKYIVKEKKINAYITTDLDMSSGNSCEDTSNEESSTEEDNA